MMDPLYRAQILLEAEQHQALVAMAHQEGRSLSGLVREIVRQYLSERELQAWTQRELQAIEALNRTRLLLREQHDMYQTDLIAEARAERDHDVERVWRGEA